MRVNEHMQRLLLIFFSLFMNRLTMEELMDVLCYGCSLVVKDMVSKDNMCFIVKSCLLIPQDSDLSRDLS